jgi:ubiquinone/menaquinone biosynthesis C-methylase UbiE
MKTEGNLTANVFDEMGSYWAEIADRNQTESQLKFLKNQLKPDGYVLDLACGTGRHSIPLSMEGYNMVGLDVSTNLLKITKQRWNRLQLVRGDMRFLPFKHQSFAAAISMDTSFGYLPSEQDDGVSLSDLRRVLRHGGVVIVDVFNRYQLMLKYKDKNKGLKWAFLPFLLRSRNRWLLFRLFKWKEYPSFFLLQKRTVTRSGERLCDLWVVCDKAKGRIVVFEHTARLYLRSEFEGLLKKAGFVVNVVYGGYEGENFSPNSQQLILMATIK